jgi:hypothetical protein
MDASRLSRTVGKRKSQGAVWHAVTFRVSRELKFGQDAPKAESRVRPRRDSELLNDLPGCRDAMKRRNFLSRSLRGFKEMDCGTRLAPRHLRIIVREDDRALHDGRSD